MEKKILVVGEQKIPVSLMQGMRQYVCLHCRFRMMATRRPDKCPKCGKVSHESQRNASFDIEEIAGFFAALWAGKLGVDLTNEFVFVTGSRTTITIR